MNTIQLQYPELTLVPIEENFNQQRKSTCLKNN